MQKNRPDIKMKQVDFTLPAKVSQSVDDFLTANPDVEGAFAGGTHQRSARFP